MAEERKAELNINEQFNSIELIFNFIPDTEMREELKEHGFRWHKQKGLWYVRNSEERMEFAQNLVDSFEQEEVLPEENIDKETESISAENIITQEDVDIVLRKGNNVVHGKYRIYDHFLKDLPLKDNIDFLREEYGMGGSSYNPVTNGKVLSEMHDSKGISLTLGDSLNPKTETLVSWSSAARSIRGFVKDGTYLTDKEKEEYPAYAEEQKTKEVRSEITKEFKDILFEYTEIKREKKEFEKNLNNYVLVECCSQFYMGEEFSHVSGQKENVISMLQKALNTIIQEEPAFTDRCKAVLKKLDGDLTKEPEKESITAPEKKSFIDHYYVVEDLKASPLNISEFNDLAEAFNKYFALPKDKMKAFGVQNSNKLPGSLDFIQCKEGKDVFVKDVLSMDNWQNPEIIAVTNKINKELDLRKAKSKANTFANTYDKIGDDYILHDSNISLLDNRRRMYLSDINIYIKRFPNENMFIYELNGAGKKGKTCKIWSISCSKDNEILNTLARRNICTIKDLYNLIQEYKKDRSVWDFDNIVIYERESKGVEIFSPFVEYEPMKKIPEKWNKVNFIHGLQSGQIYAGEINERLTDDYRMDAANNFCKGIRIDMAEAARRETEGWSNSTYVYAGEPDKNGIIPIHYSSAGTHKTYYFDINCNIAEGKRRFEEVNKGIERYNKMLESSCSKITAEDIDLSKIYVIKSLDKDTNTKVFNAKTEVLQGATIIDRMYDNELPVLKLEDFPVEDNKFYSVSNFYKRPTTYIEEDQRTIHMGNWEYLVTGKALKEMTSESFYFPHIRISPENETFEQVQNNILKGTGYGVGDRANAVESIKVLKSEYSRATEPRTSSLSDLISKADKKRETNNSFDKEIRNKNERGGETR